VHVAGRDAALVARALAPLRGRPGLRITPADASLEDVFISLIGQAQDNFGNGAAPS
jgi:ABC-2 type transport system ATP-binding protein